MKGPTLQNLQWICPIEINETLKIMNFVNRFKKLINNSGGKHKEKS
jgi:hypothetical protein